MSSSNLIRLSGLAAVVAGVLLAIVDVVGFLVLDFENFSEVAATGTYAFISGLFMIATLLLLLGLVGLYARQSEVTGFLGLLGFLVAFIGTALVLGSFWAQEFVAPAAAEVAPEFLDSEPGWLNFGFSLSFSLFSLGWLLFGVATLRARIYPRIAALILIIGAVVAFLPFPLTSLVLDVAVAWMGLTLLSGGRAPATSTMTTGAQPRVQ